jgi:hypothetical protein
LHCSDHRITWIAESYANSLHELATLQLPDLCGDVGAWKTSAFQVVPASAVRLDAHVAAIELNPIPPRLLAPYERGADASVLARTKPLEMKLEENEFSVRQTDWYEVFGTLGLNP